MTDLLIDLPEGGSMDVYPQVPSQRKCSRDLPRSGGGACHRRHPQLKMGEEKRD